jgi:hypothetical protein
MFGRLLGKAIALPVRIVNAPFRAAAKLAEMEDEAPDPLGALADAIEDTTAELIGDEDE